MHNPPDGPGDRIPGEQSNRRLRLRHEGQENIKKRGDDKMDEETRTEIQAALSFLRAALVGNAVSMAVSAENGGQLYFFDTEKYLKTKKMDGIHIAVDKLVR